MLMFFFIFQFDMVFTIEKDGHIVLINKERLQNAVGVGNFSFSGECCMEKYGSFKDCVLEFFLADKATFVLEAIFQWPALIGRLECSVRPVMVEDPTILLEELIFQINELFRKMAAVRPVISKPAGAGPMISDVPVASKGTKSKSGSD